MADFFDSGFTVRERSWHGKENLLAEAPETWDDARLAAGLMWEPRLVPLYFRDGDNEDGTPRFTVDTGAQRVERDDTGDGIGTVSGSFELITHAEMGQIMEPVLEVPGCRLDTMGSVKGGRSVYATVLLDEPYEIAGDIDGFGDQVTTLPYFAILNSHDGTGACKGLFTQVRVVCWNTVQAADADGDRHGAQFALRHTSGVKDRIAEARQIIDRCRDEAARWKAIAEELAKMPVTEEQQLQFLDEFIPLPTAKVVSDRQIANAQKDRDRFLFVLRESPTNSGMAHNALGLFNAATEWADHLRGFRSRDTYMGRQILRAEPMKAQALRTVRELVGSSS